MALIKIIKNRVPLDSNYENPILFKNVKNGFNGNALLTSLSPLEFLSQYDNSVNNLESYIKINFRYGNTLTTRVVVNLSFLTPSEASTIYDCNYCIVRQDENPKLPTMLFYFINGMSFEKGVSTITLDLEVDVFTTFNKWSLGTSEVMTTRQHVDRFKNEATFNCEEALLPDIIDSQFNANIISKNEKLRNNDYTYLMVYLSLNTPRTALSNIHCYAPQGEGDFDLVCSETDYNIITTNNSTFYNGYNLPYIVGFLPLNSASSIKLVVDDWLNDQGSEKVKVNYYYDNSKFHYKDKYLSELLIDNPYVLATQIVSFTKPFIESINFETSTTNEVVILDNSGKRTFNVSKYYRIAPLLIFKKTDIKTIIKDASYIKDKNEIFEYFYGLDISLNTPLLKDKRLEPKLYASPFAYFVLNGASYKGMALEPLGVGNKLEIIETFVPTPLVNGNYYTINSGIYSNTKANYMTISPYLTSEIPSVQSSYKEFLATQKNSYAQGVTMSYFNNAIGTGSGIVSSAIGLSTGYPIGTASGIISTIQSVTNLIAKPFEVQSKMKDLKQTPSKITSSNYDIYSVVGITDLSMRFNYITMLDTEQNKVFDFFYRNGYQVERTTAPQITSNDITINTNLYAEYPALFNRRIFNYIKLDQDITNELKSPTGLSQAIRNKFNSILNRGCRLWNVTSTTKYLDFSYENYEANKEGTV